MSQSGTRDGDKVTVRMGKSIATSDVGRLKTEFKGYVDEGVKTIALDCTEVEIIDSIGIGLLVATHNTLKRSDGSLVLENPSDDIRQLLATMRLDKHFSITGT